MGLRTKSDYFLPTRYYFIGFYNRDRVFTARYEQDIGTQLRLIFVFEVLTTTSKLSEVMFYWPQLYPYFISCVYFLRKKFTHSSFCLTTGPQPLPVSSRFLKIVQYLLTSFCLSSRHSYPPFYLSFNSVF